jgi:hypothetical protein
VPASGCAGTFKNGTFSFSGQNIFITGSSFSCADGPMLDYERLKTALRFYSGSKRITLGPKQSATLAGYRIRVGLANSKQATFTIDRVKKA